MTSDAATRAQHVFKLVTKRLEMGAEQYGDEDYLVKDCLLEAETECLDIIAYAAMQWLKINDARARRDAAFAMTRGEEIFAPPGEFPHKIGG